MIRTSAAAALLLVTVLVGGCGESDDLRQDEAEIDEDGTEVVPGEGGPVD